MPKALRSLWIVPVVLLLAAGDVPQKQGAQLVVTRKITRLRSAKRLLAPSVADLQEGDKLVFEQKDGAWLSVHYKDLAGFVHETDVSDKADVRLSGEGIRENYSASEASAARKGFNPQVEKEYRASKPELEAAFKLVDRIQSRKVDEDKVRAFVDAGGLGQGGGK
ncbi:MAG: hypothetical protein U1F36_06230 [Planctomycetota bacterium]